MDHGIRECLLLELRKKKVDQGSDESGDCEVGRGRRGATAGGPRSSGTAGRGEAQSRKTRPKMLPPLLRLTSVPISTTGWPEGSA